MERIRHIRETQPTELLQTQSADHEADPIRKKIIQDNAYDFTSEIHSEQIRVREYLSSFNEVVLKDIFSEYFRRAGSQSGTINWIAFNKVRILPTNPEAEIDDTKTYGTYSPTQGIVLYADKIDNGRAALWALIHEMCHAVSQNELIIELAEQTAATIRGTVHTKSGIQTSSTNIDFHYDERGEPSLDSVSVPDMVNNQANEGITELLTDRIYNAYLTRTGISSDEHELNNLDRKLFQPYGRDWKNMQLYIGLLSVLADIDTSVVEEAVIRAYLRNAKIMPREVKKELDAIDPSLSARLQNMINNEDSDTTNQKDELFMDIFELPTITNEQRTRLIQMLESQRYETIMGYKRYIDILKKQNSST